ncbi:NAD(P)H-dependent oxidoreductase [Candidatus Woesearchaeota archaeon]|nr:NAD(P)H-dependent oxidoreductase [Candidatus Woesearchaeota archaeon]
MSILIINGSANPNSKTDILCNYLAKQLSSCEYLDLRLIDVPRCGSKLSSLETNVVKDFNDKIKSASGVIICTPIYGQFFSGLIKDFFDLVSTLKLKPVLLCETLATEKSSLAIQNISNYFLFGHGAFVFPKFLMVQDVLISDSANFDEPLEKRIKNTLSLFETFVKQRLGE